MRRIFVIRHGNTFASGEEPRRIGSRTDIPLVESGVAQAAVLGEWFAGLDIHVERLLSSPLQRARETAGEIATATGHGLDGARDWLGEIDHGPDEGLSEGEVLARIGAAALTRWEEQGVAPDGWIVDADMRLAAWRAFFAEPGDGVDLLVTSNGAARFALLALGLPPRKLRTGAFGEFAVEAGGSVRLVRWDERP
ncbi:histidine phosphatase family protein [Sphingobium sp.]|uniref:histidine phosphatase family protein n=1 Tax=Sphingobium sp. TaxID=1912891 RepID=UPI002C5FD013|nr:histidine phosphatase family protein [Sphingobium sp.]HUD93221.1 histidine phosphatase family protein [Sphingobium sp.]